MNVWQPLIFFEGESETEIKAQFVQVSARHRNNPNFTPIDVARYVFRDKKEPELRALQAAEYWSKDLDVQQQIQDLANYAAATDAKQRRVNLLMQIAEDARTLDKDRIAAIRVAAELEGEIVKAVSKKVEYPNGKPPISGFMFAVDPDADKPPAPEEDDADD